MADVSKLIADLIQAGLDPMLVGRVAATIAEAAAPAPVVAVAETAEERKKRIKSENNQRAYEAKKAERERLNAPEKDLNAPESAAPETDLNAPEVHLNQATLARVEDKLTNTNLSGNLTTLNAASDFPEKPSREQYDDLEAALRAEASPAINPTSPRLFDLSPIIGLLRGGKGPPCELNTDVLPVVRARSKSARPNSVKTWDFYREAIVEARDRRLAAAPNVTALEDWRAPRKPSQQVEDEFEAARQRVIERFQ